MNVTIEQSAYEIERGKPMPSKAHALIQNRIGKFIDRKYGDDFLVLPELSLEIDGQVKIPDLAIYKEQEFSAKKEELKVKTMPITAIEILSPKQNIADLIVKSYAYFDAGVKSYWLVVPALESIYIYHDKGEYDAFVKKDKVVKDKILGIELELAPIFK